MNLPASTPPGSRESRVVVFCYSADLPEAADATVAELVRKMRDAFNESVALGANIAAETPKPIPVLHPLGRHRAPGGQRILHGGGSNPANLIRLI